MTFKVKGNKVLASARRRLKHVTGDTLKPRIHQMLKDGLTGTCSNIEVEQLRLWCGMPSGGKAPRYPASAKAKKPVQKPSKKKVATKSVAKKKQATVSDINQKAKPKRSPKGTRPNGGAGRGQGRKVSSTTKKTRAIAEKLVAEDEITPLEYMLSVLRETPEKLKAQHEAGDIDVVEYTIKMQDLIRRKDQAAEKAAPYIHPRLSSIEANVGLKGQDLFAALLEKEAQS